MSVRVHTRSKGHSAAAALGYRLGVDLVDSRTGVEHAYGRRAKCGDVLATGMEGAGVFADVAAFAAAIEAAERRKNSSILRDVQVALPCELGKQAGAALLQEFAQMLAERYDTHVAWAMHRADERGDVRNGHGHLVLPTRELGEDGRFGKKLRVLDDRTTGPGEVKELRRLWEGTANTYLETEGVEARVDVSRRLEGAPMPTLGAACTALERKEATARGELVKGKGRATGRRTIPEVGPAAPSPAVPQRKSMAALVTEGEPVTWRGVALRHHQRQAQREAEQQDQELSVEDVARVPCAEVQVADAARPARVDLRRGPSRPAGVVPVARPDVVAQPERIELRREEPRRPGVRVGEAHPEPVATPAPIALRRRETTPVAAYEVRVQAVGKPEKVVLAPRAPAPSTPVDVRQVRPAPVATPQQPAARTEPVVAQPIRVRPVHVARNAVPTKQDLSALETPPSLQELSDELYEKVYAGQDPAAAVQPADPGQSISIGYANWPVVQDAVRRDDVLCRAVAAGAADRAKDEGQQNDDVHRSWDERIAVWIREHVAAALELLGLRQRQEAEVRKDRVRLGARTLPAELPKAPPYSSNPSYRVVAVSFARLDRVAAATKDKFERQVIAEFQKRHGYDDDMLTKAEEAYLRPLIERRHEEDLATYEQEEAERGLFSRRLPEPTWAQAEAVVIEAYETELLGVIEEVCADVQQRPIEAVRSELQRLDAGSVLERVTASRPAPDHDRSGQERGSSGQSR